MGGDRVRGTCCMYPLIVDIILYIYFDNEVCRYCVYLASDSISGKLSSRR